jgi:hypothetical protein
LFFPVAPPMELFFPVAPPTGLFFPVAPPMELPPSRLAEGSAAPHLGPPGSSRSSAGRSGGL